MEIKKVFFLSGLSECGKSLAGEWATTNGIFRLKIIYFEKIIASLKGMSMTSKKEVKDVLEILYLEKEKMFLEFRNFIYEFMLANKCSAISLESLYRAELAKSFTEDFRFKTEIIYIEADIDKRVEREFLKKKKDYLAITFDQVKNETLEKDKFKISNGVLEVKEIATKIVENNNSIEDFKNQIDKIFNSNR